ncbi:glycosyl transferase family 1 [Leptospira sp. 201903071]|uniref:glycosyl transferase family 1 n=1 Tax=Leptospira ainazelensis TaxID=2810034 RepID=UPI00196387D2|nr:glycosyl transferase family 1 [Leptospira ainazelensis]MBM9501964.1 glycosyl transferase family 1 [Leptospira ainazelensis]
MKILILTEAGEGIGLGHITRTNALGSYLKNQGDEIDIWLSVKGDSIPFSDQYEIFDWLNHHTARFHEFQEYDLVVMDSYLASRDLIKLIDESSRKLVVIDDFNRLVYTADLIINPNVFFSKIDYRNQKCRVLGGNNFVILRKLFRDYKAKQETKTKEKGILISIGGSDYRQLLPKLAGLFLKFEGITIVCPELDPLIKLAEQFPKVRFLGHLNETRMLTEISRAEIVISGCGQSLNELYFLQKKTIGICIDHDQVLSQDYYFESGFLKSKLSWDSANLLENIDEMIRNLLSNPFQIPFSPKLDPEQSLKNYSAVFQSLCDSSARLS